MDVVTADNAADLSQLLSEAVAQALRSAIDEHGKASLVVSGGSTPVPFFKHLSQLQLDWQKVVVTLADERWVPYEHDDSNERLVCKYLLQNRAAAARFCSLYDATSDTPEAGSLVVSKRLENQLPMPITVLILGMGTDGHTASLFPNTSGLEQAMALDNPAIVQIMHPEASPHARITLTRRALLESSNRFLHITGSAKKALIDSIDTPTGKSLPIAGFLGTTQIAVYWSP
ncbi:MAG: 6-phosphogluconolactonase [Granulosicoccaceae bacterium]